VLTAWGCPPDDVGKFARAITEALQAAMPTASTGSSSSCSLRSSSRVK